MSETKTGIRHVLRGIVADRLPWPFEDVGRDSQEFRDHVDLVTLELSEHAERMFAAHRQGLPSEPAPPPAPEPVITASARLRVLEEVFESLVLCPIVALDPSVGGDRLGMRRSDASAALAKLNRGVVPMPGIPRVAQDAIDLSVPASPDRDEAARRLIAEWRERAQTLKTESESWRDGGVFAISDRAMDVAGQLERCADDLESLYPAPVAPGEAKS